MVFHPVTRTRAHHEAIPFAAYSEPISGAYADLPQQMSRQSYLVLTAYGSHSITALAADNILHSRLGYFTTAS